eukprot:TRINITY_DN273_c0_g1_i4.p2 TRINITY_DN273_c0_g1~~TRINITY_DN273_c0_g1_i4.p2  ORF type:complete len:112 (-),score=1.19 TRINITY_DN273_c0_g1_i4:164-499(-)
MLTGATRRVGSPPPSRFPHVYGFRTRVSLSLVFLQTTITRNHHREVGNIGPQKKKKNCCILVFPFLRVSRAGSSKTVKTRVRKKMKVRNMEKKVSSHCAALWYRGSVAVSV